MERLKWLLTGGAIPFLLLLVGGFFFLYLRARPFSRPRLMWQALRTPTEGSGVSPFRALMLALAGTLGVGNLVGVANAIAIGGAGAVFWMWMSALVAMILKYAEILLAVSHRRVRERGGYLGGAYYYIKDYFVAHRHTVLGVVVSGLFALLMLLDSLTMGCMLQVEAVSAAFEGVCQVPMWVSGMVLVAVTLPVIMRGQRGISALTEVLVPIMSAGYLILTVAVLCARPASIGQAFGSIFRQALCMESVGGGILGFLTSQALRTGTMRGLLSNEAGCGTAPTAHASADAHSPAAQGVWGIAEVFVDTVVLCTATAMVILVSLPEVELLKGNAVMMTVRAYSCVLGDWSEWFLCAAILCFGYATLLCWAGYGMECLAFLSKRRGLRVLYGMAFGICILIGATRPSALVWTLSDFAISAMTALNLLMLLLMRREVKAETDRYFSRRTGRVGLDTK